MRIKADKSPMVINDDGMPISVPYHGSAVVSDTIGSDMINAGLAVEYTETSPTGTIEINDNGVYDVFDYAYASVNVPKGGGGGGDLDTFHVTITDETGGSHTFSLPNLAEDGDMTALAGFYMTASTDPNTIDVVGYEGVAVGMVNITGLEVTGDIVANDYSGIDTILVITGDGTITIPDK